MATQISITAALHCLGNALGSQDDHLIDQKELDIDKNQDLPDYESNGEAMECEEFEPSSSTCPIARVPVENYCMIDALGNEKPRCATNLTRKDLNDALARPENSADLEWRLKPRIPRKGRTAYKLEVYQAKTAVKVI